MFFILISSLGVLMGFAFQGVVHRLFPAAMSNTFDRINECSVAIVRWLAVRLFGLRTRKQEIMAADDWTGRLSKSFQTNSPGETRTVRFL